MKTAEEYFNDFCTKDNQDLLRVKYDVCLLIKRAQLDAIEETVEACAEEADTCEYPHDMCPECFRSSTYVDKQSILNVKTLMNIKLKKI